LADPAGESKRITEKIALKPKNENVSKNPTIGEWL
jgi:hypothetical protein